jgi:hypothetical protein
MASLPSREHVTFQKTLSIAASASSRNIRAGLMQLMRAPGEASQWKTTKHNADFLKAGVLYFLVAFAARFMLGPTSAFYWSPRDSAPRRLAVPPTPSSRLGMGGLARRTE